MYATETRTVFVLFPFFQDLVLLILTRSLRILVSLLYSRNQRNYRVLTFSDLSPPPARMPALCLVYPEVLLVLLQILCWQWDHSLTSRLAISTQSQGFMTHPRTSRKSWFVSPPATSRPQYLLRRSSSNSWFCEEKIQRLTKILIN